MAVNNPPRFLNAGSHDAEQDRRMIKILTAGGEGIVNSGDFLVSQRAGTPDLSVDVAAGEVVIIGTEDAAQGSYIATSDTVTNLVIGTPPGANSRIDIVVAKIQDSEYSGATDAFSLAVVEGVVDPSPVAPAVPANGVKLAEVLVASTDSTVVNSMITDTRPTLTIQSTTAQTADRLTTARDISLTGDATGTTSFDGSANAAITVTLPNAADMTGSDGAGRLLTVSATQPSSPTTGDLWVDIS